MKHFYDQWWVRKFGLLSITIWRWTFHSAKLADLQTITHARAVRDRIHQLAEETQREKYHSQGERIFELRRR